MWRYNHQNSHMRILFLANTPRGGPSHTVLVTDIPGLNYGTMGWALRGVSHWLRAEGGESLAVR